MVSSCIYANSHLVTFWSRGLYAAIPTRLANGNSGEYDACELKIRHLFGCPTSRANRSENGGRLGWREPQPPTNHFIRWTNAWSDMMIRAI